MEYWERQKRSPSYTPLEIMARNLNNLVELLFGVFLFSLAQCTSRYREETPVLSIWEPVSVCGRDGGV